MPMTLDDDECYQAFLMLDSYARHLEGKNEKVNRMRERFLPFYRDWHAANPYRVHPSCYERADEPSEVTVRRMRTEDWPERY